MAEISKHFIFEVMKRLTKQVNQIISIAFRDMEIILDFKSMVNEGIRTEDVLEALSNKSYSGQFYSASTIRFIVYKKYSK